MYESIARGSPDGGNTAAVSHHQGSRWDFLRRHEADARRAARAGLRAVKDLAPFLLNRVADPRTLRLAWDDLAAGGGRAPGPNGRIYSDYDSSEAWGLCKCLAGALRDGTYRPGPERVVWVDKASGKGQRPLVLLNVEDRAVQRAAVLILQPLLDPLFDGRSFGYRPGRGHLHALALGEYLTVKQGRRVWVTQDVKDAYQHVPVRRLLQVVGKFLPDERLAAFLGRVLTGRGLPDLRQGGPLSPLMLNKYLDHFLDRPWRRDHPRLPLIRVADDLLIPCRGARQAGLAHADLAALLLPAGMPLKYAEAEAVRDLGDGGVVTWMGFDLSKKEGGLAAEIGGPSWGRLEECFALAHTRADSPLRAARSAGQWLDQRGPCYPWSDRGQVCEKVIELARGQGFEELPTADELAGRWQRAYARWCKLRKKVRDDCRRAAADS